MAGNPHRVIIREHEFEEQLVRLIPNVEEADEFVAGAELFLSEHPDAGHLASEEYGVWTLAMAPIRDMQVTLYYPFDDEAVTFLAILGE